MPDAAPRRPIIRRDTPVEDILPLAPACRCEACSHGCTMGSGFLVDEDIPKLASLLHISEEELKAEHLEQVEKFHTTRFRPKLVKNRHGYGKCTFYDEEKGCTVHEAKPLHCKVAMGCKDYGEDIDLWFHLNHFVDADDPESVRQFASYLAAGGKTLPGGKLEDIVPDKERLKRILGYKILSKEQEQNRRAIRNIFQK
jgi:Fe-S-cluster containining protein